MTHKAYDLAVVTGTYTDRNSGTQKNSYKTIGALMRTDDGGQFILLDPLINLAAVPRGQGKDKVMVSLFEPREANNPQQPPAVPNQPTEQYPTAQQFQQPPQNNFYNPDGSPKTPQQMQAMQGQQR